MRQRFSRVTRAEKQVACPRVVCVYNAHMGGVDLLDALIGLYRPQPADDKLSLKRRGQRHMTNLRNLHPP